MNRYIVSKSLLMILRHWKLHLSFALQMAAGIAVIYAYATLSHSAALQYQRLQAEISGMIWDVTAAYERPASRPPLDYEQYVRLREAYPGASFPFCIAYAVYYTADGTDIRTAWLLFASDDFLETVLGAEGTGFERGRAAYAGGEARALLEGRYRIIHQDTPLPLDAGGALTGEDGARLSVLPVEALGTGRTRITHHDLEDIPLDRAALLPLAAYYPLFKPEDAGRFKLSVKLGRNMSGDEATAAVMEILSTLLEWNGGDYHYNVRTALQHFLLRYEEVRANAAVAAAVAGLCLAIVLIGLVAVVQLIYIRRSKAFAVSSALGAGKGSLFMELCLESVLPSFAGGLLGTAACAWYLSEFVHAIAIRQSPAVMAAAAAVSLAPGCLAAGSLAFRIRRLRPLEILRRDQAWR
jgi:ABC-type antimicrobial peptide transport system, permease component